MAERRMFAKSVVQSDAFGEMPLTTQALYFHIGMEADDDGFLDNALRLVRSIGASRDDMRLLIAKGFIFDMGDGVFVIRDWKISNYLRSDRYKGTRHADKAALLCMEKGQPYRLASNPQNPFIRADDPNPSIDGIPVGIPHGRQVVSIGKDRLGKDSNNIYIPENGDGICAFDAPNGTPNVDNSASIDEQPAPMAALPEPKRKPRKKADRAETPDFIRFYTEYPRHEARAAAWEAWAKLDPSPELVETIIDHVKRRKTTAWRGVEKQHIPHPSTFINQRRWTDELPKRSGFSSQEIDY